MIELIIRKADKYARDKNYNCLLPGCTRRAIRSHAIPRPECFNALACNGVVYTQAQSFNYLMNVKTPVASGYKSSKLSCLGLEVDSGMQPVSSKARRMGVFSNSVTLRTCRIWKSEASSGTRFLTMATST